MVDPLAATKNKVVSVEEETWKGLTVPTPAPLTDRVEMGVADPTPNRVLELSQVKEVLVATGEVPLPKSIRLAVRAGAPVPPLATGRMPVTLAARSMVELVMSELVTRPMNKAPEADLTTPEPKEDKVVEPVIVTIPVTVELAK